MRLKLLGRLLLSAFFFAFGCALAYAVALGYVLAAEERRDGALAALGACAALAVAAFTGGAVSGLWSTPASTLPTPPGGDAP